MRIALVSPYSWTYPGGVTRHIEALAAELAAGGHEPHILAPFDPDDRLSRRLHRGAAPQRHPVPEGFVSLGRTVGVHANGAVSNMALTPHAVNTLRAELRGGGYDLAHIHEPVVPTVSWDALCSAGELPLVGTFHTYSENTLTNGFAAVPLGGRRRMNRLHGRIAVSDAAAWTARRYFGGHYRIIPNGVRLDERAEIPVEHDRASRELRILFIGQAVERKGLPVLLRAFEALREHLPATLTLVGAASEEVAHMILDGSGVQALGKVSEPEKLRRLAEADVLCAPSLSGESFGMVLTEAFAAATPVVASDIPGYRDVVRDGVDGLLSPPGDALALAETLRRIALDEPMRHRMALAARERAERFAWRHVAAEAVDCYEQAIVTARRAQDPAASGLTRRARRLGLAPSRHAAPRTGAAPGKPAAAAPCCRAQRQARAAYRTPRRPRLQHGRRHHRGGAGPAAGRRDACGCVAGGLQARPARGGPGADVRGDVRPCDRLARDPHRGADLAAGETARRDAGHLHRRANECDPAGAARRAVASADSRPPPRPGARDAARRARDDGLPDPDQPRWRWRASASVTLSRVSVLDGHDRDLLLVALAPLAALLVGTAGAGADPALGGVALAAAAGRDDEPAALADAAPCRGCGCSASRARPPIATPPSSVRGRCNGCPAGCC